LGIVEVIVILAVALIVIPPENLPDVMRAAGKILRELRLASNMVMRELGGALDPPSAEEPVPPINTMKPSVIATGSNIAQSLASADSATPADSSAAPAPLPTTPAVPKASE
jgi:Sec-independent protein translocase protein TatA